LLERFPLTTNGKLDRRSLPAPELDGDLTRPYEPPAGQTEQTLATIWQEVLGVPRIGRHDDFFESGGHSISAMQALVRIRAAFPIELPMSALFKLRTLRELSARIEELHQAMLPEPTDTDDDELLEQLASMPESDVNQLMQELSIRGTP